MGVHLEEPTSPGSDRWSEQLTSPVKSQWTDEDLDAFVRQLSNPQHQVTRVRNSAGRSNLDSPRKTSFDLCHELKDRERVRAPLARSETDTSVSFGDLGSPTFEGPKPLGKLDRDKGGSGGGGLISGLSGLRLIKNKKLARTSHSHVKKNSTSALASSSPSLPTKTEGSDHLPTSNTVTFSCNSSPEGSDGDPDPEAQSSDVKDIASANGGAGYVKEPGKKRRFRKMLTRPLNRSQSAGCAKDVPAHALFMEQQRIKSKEAESISERKNRASEGDIRANAGSGDEENELDVEEDSAQTETRGPEKRTGRIHKTKSADAAMMASDEFGALNSHPTKSKSRNIAKKITKKMQFLRRRHTDSTLGMVDSENEGARRLAHINPADAHEWSKSFESLLYDKSGLELFRGFLMSEHSDENIEFWIACENYKNVRSNKQMTQLAHRIYNDYVAVQSRREVNLDSKTRNLTYDGVSSNPNRQTFDEAQRRVQALMEKDSYRRFLESELYQDLAAGNIHQKS